MIKHNKKKNTGIVYEQLLHVVTRLVANNLQEEASYVVDVMKKYFNERTELGKEKKLFDSLIENEKAYSEVSADTLLKETIQQAKTIDSQRLEREKNSLIQEVSSNLDKDLFNIPLKEYKLFASIQTLFNEERNNYKYTVPKERIKVRSTIIKKLTESKESTNLEEVDNFTFKVLIEKYNKKYQKLLSENQQELLKDWMIYLMNENKELFKSSLEGKVEKIKSTIGGNLNIHEDKEYSNMLKEAYSKACSVDLDNVNEELVFEVMRFMDVCEDLELINKDSFNGQE